MAVDFAVTVCSCLHFAKSTIRLWPRLNRLKLFMAMLLESLAVDTLELLLKSKIRREYRACDHRPLYEANAGRPAAQYFGIIRRCWVLGRVSFQVRRSKDDTFEQHSNSFCCNFPNRPVICLQLRTSSRENIVPKQVVRRGAKIGPSWKCCVKKSKNTRPTGKITMQRSRMRPIFSCKAQFARRQSTLCSKGLSQSFRHIILCRNEKYPMRQHEKISSKKLDASNHETQKSL